jgi:hypothetical protein
LDARLLLIVL